MRPLASIYRGRWLADLTGKGHSPVVALGYKNRQEVDPGLAASPGPAVRQSELSFISA